MGRKGNFGAEGCCTVLLAEDVVVGVLPATLGALTTAAGGTGAAGAATTKLLLLSRILISLSGEAGCMEGRLIMEHVHYMSLTLQI